MEDGSFGSVCLANGQICRWRDKPRSPGGLSLSLTSYSKSGREEAYLPSGVFDIKLAYSFDNNEFILFFN